jgi:hypothetical protein
VYPKNDAAGWSNGVFRYTPTGSNGVLFGKNQPVNPNTHPAVLITIRGSKQDDPNLEGGQKLQVRLRNWEMPNELPWYDLPTIEKGTEVTFYLDARNELQRSTPFQVIEIRGHPEQGVDERVRIRAIQFACESALADLRSDAAKKISVSYNGLSVILALVSAIAALIM